LEILRANGTATVAVLRNNFSLSRGPHILASLSAVGVKRMKEFADWENRKRKLENRKSQTAR
jgi:hypothetical protein